MWGNCVDGYSAYRSQKMALNPLELELPAIVDHHMGAWNFDPGSLQELCTLHNAKPSTLSLVYFFKLVSCIPDLPPTFCACSQG